MAGPAGAAARIDPRLPIGVFDSGVGGLTVLRALLATLPEERFVYLGDTARLPYGTKTPATVVRYAEQAAQALVDRGIKALVIACNTASAAALPALTQRFPGLPVLGVVEPGAEAASRVTRGGVIGVLATEATVRGGAYERAILTRLPSAIVRSQACQVLVALAEEGWFDGPEAQAAVARYLRALRAEAPAMDTLVLGCTHFPLLLPALRRELGEGIAIVDSAATTAAATRRALERLGLCAPAGGAHLQLLATDGAQRFAQIGGRFLGRSLRPDEIELLDL